MKEIQEINLTEILKIVNQDITIEYLPNLPKGILDIQLKIISKCSLIELAIQTGYIGNILPHEIVLDIKSSLNSLKDLNILQFTNTSLIFNLLTRLSKQERENNTEFLSSFISFLTLFDDIDYDITFYGLITEIKTNYQKSILKLNVELNLMNLKKDFGEIGFLYSCFKFQGFLIEFDDFLNEVVENEILKNSYKEFFEVYFKDINIYNFFRSFDEKISKLLNDQEHFEDEKFILDSSKNLNEIMNKFWNK